MRCFWSRELRVAAFRRVLRERECQLLGRTETDCPLGTGHSSGFNSADLADVRERVITTPTCRLRPPAFLEANEVSTTRRRYVAGMPIRTHRQMLLVMVGAEAVCALEFGKRSLLALTDRPPVSTTARRAAQRTCVPGVVNG
jgi:hypothetical protein